MAADVLSAIEPSYIYQGVAVDNASPFATDAPHSVAEFIKEDGDDAA